MAHLKPHATSCALALVAWLAGTTAQANQQPTKMEVTEAQRRFVRATELFEENNLAGALAEFRKAYSLAPNYKVLYNIGQVCYLMQDSPCAYAAFSSYLEQGAGEIPERRRDEVQRDLARLRARVARLRIVADKPGAEVTVDDVTVGTTPLEEPVLVAAGRLRIRVSLKGYAPVTRVIEVAGMETAYVEMQLDPAAVAGASPGDAGSAAATRSAPPPELPAIKPAAPTPGPDITRTAAQPTASSGGGMRVAGILLGVVGAAGLAGGVLASLQVRLLEREIETAKLGQFDASKLSSQQQKATRYQNWQWVGYAAGGAALLGSIIFLVTGGDGDGPQEQAAGPHLIGSLGPGGSPQVGLVGRF
jgi:hypothetical protein